MKMRAFSILITLVCIGFVLMLAGSTAHAANHDTAALTGEAKPSKDAPEIGGKYPKGKEVKVTFTLTIGGNPAMNTEVLTITATDVTATVTLGESPPLLPPFPLVPGAPTAVNVGGNGMVKIDVIVGEKPGEVRATYGQHTSVLDFPVEGKKPRQPVIVVLPPQETLYADGLLENLPKGFDKTWLGDPTWVTDYCALAERPINPPPPQLKPQPIRLADGPRYNTNAPPANAQAYRDSVGNLFTAVVEIRDVEDLSAWQMDVAFNPQILKALRVREGNFLAKENPDDPGNYDPFFLPGLINNDVGVITGIAQARVGRKAALTTDNPLGVTTGAGMAGILFCIDFQVLEFAEEALGLHNVQLSTSQLNPNTKAQLDPDKQRISYYTAVNPVVVTHKFPAVDVNRDRKVDILDLMAVAGAMPPPDGDGGRDLGKANPINPRADVTDDGIINALDLIAVSSHADWGTNVDPIDTRDPNSFVGPPTAPALVGDPAALTPAAIQGWIDIAQVEDDGSAIFDLGIANLERLLQATVPERTRLLLNYPNPFNPETWIPYQLANATDVSVSIYSVNGALVRTLALGHQAAGVYQSRSRAAYWDGRNELGEQVASGVYFYTLTAGGFSATGKMLVRK